jgi:phage-related protein
VAGSVEAAISWEGDSKDVISAFPDAVKEDLGFQLRQLQQGERPKNYRPLTALGQGVFELRDQDAYSWYRVVYLSRINDVIYVLHCFEKKSLEIPKREENTIKDRLQDVRTRIAAQKAQKKR